MSKTSEALKHNINEIRKYLEYAPSFIGPGAPPGEPLGKKHRGTSRVPATEAAHDFYEANRDASRILDPMIRQLYTGEHKWKGIYFSTVLTIVYSDPTAVPKWDDRKTDEDNAYIGAFFKMCRLLADAISADPRYGPDRQINVEISEKSKQAKSRTEARDQDRRHTAQEAYRDLAKLVERTITAKGCGAEEAIKTVADLNEVSIRKVKYAREFVAEEQKAS